MHRIRRFFLFCLLATAAAVHAADGDDLLGTHAPPLQLDAWLNSEPLTEKDLAGKVVLLRWWTAPQCPYCRATAPALNEFHEKYAPKGLLVIGVYHHKVSTPLTAGHVKTHAEKFGFKFPIATDPDWRTLKKWWLNSDDKRWTSVTFLLDRKGVIRHIHPGGQYVKGDPAHAALQSRIEQLLSE